MDRHDNVRVFNREPHPNHFEIPQVENSSRTYYDAARVSLILPYWRGLTVDTAYWFSKALDLGTACINTATGDDAKQAAACPGIWCRRT